VLNRFIKENEIDIVVLEYAQENNFYFMILKWLNRAKYAVSFLGSDINLMSSENWAIRKSIIWQARNANGVTACSKMLMKTVANAVEKLPDNHQVIYLGVDPQWATNVSDVEYDLPENYILTLAWAVPIKGPDIVIRAFAKLVNEYADIHLVMTGSGPMEDELRELIKELGIRDQVMRLGEIPLNHLPHIYQEALFGVIPSRNEGFPAVSLEFQLFKKAIIASNVGGLPESIVDDFNGYLVPPGDVDALAEKIKYLLDNPNVCRRLGENGFGNVRSRFTQEMTADHLQQFLGSIVDEA
jgi:glycosyltransferase involved in cell wall biosynthesis